MGLAGVGPLGPLTLFPHAAQGEKYTLANPPLPMATPVVEIKGASGTHPLQGSPVEGSETPMPFTEGVPWVGVRRWMWLSHGTLLGLRLWERLGRRWMFSLRPTTSARVTCWGRIPSRNAHKMEWGVHASQGTLPIRVE